MRRDTGQQPSQKEVCRNRLLYLSSLACLLQAAHLHFLQGRDSNGSAGVRLQCGLNHHCSRHATAAGAPPVTGTLPLGMQRTNVQPKCCGTTFPACASGPAPAPLLSGDIGIANTLLPDTPGQTEYPPPAQALLSTLMTAHADALQSSLHRRSLTSSSATKRLKTPSRLPRGTARYRLSSRKRPFRVSHLVRGCRWSSWSMVLEQHRHLCICAIYARSATWCAHAPAGWPCSSPELPSHRQSQPLVRMCSCSSKSVARL